MFIVYENGCKSSLHLVIDWKTGLEHGQVANCKRKSSYAPCAVSVTLPIYWHVAHGYLLVTSISDLTLLRVIELLRRNMLVLCIPILGEKEYFALPM